MSQKAALTLAIVVALAVSTYYATLDSIAPNDRQVFGGKSSAQVTVECPTTDNYYVYYENQGLTDQQVFDILNQLHQCPTWSSLKYLSFSLDENQLTTFDPIYQAIAGLEDLVQVSVSMQSNRLTSSGLQKFAQAWSNKPKLTTLQIFFGKNLISDVTFLKGAISRNLDLQTVTLTMQENDIQDISPLAGEFQTLPNIQSLTIDISLNRLETIEPLKDSFVNIESLTIFDLQFEGNSQLGGMGVIPSILSGHPRLEYLTLNLNSCGLQDLSQLQTVLENELTQLTALSFDFSFNQINNVDPINRGLEKLTKLTQLSLFYNDNEISDVSTFEAAFQALERIKAFTLIINSNSIENGVPQFEQSLINYIAKRDAFCPFYVDVQNNPFLRNQALLEQTQQTNNELQALAQKTEVPCFPVMIFDF